MSKAELKKRSEIVDRKMPRKHKTKVGEVLDILDKDGGTKLYKKIDIKQLNLANWQCKKSRHMLD